MRKLLLLAPAFALLFTSLLVQTGTAHADSPAGTCKVSGVTYKVHTIRLSRNFPIQVVASSSANKGYDISVALFEVKPTTGKHVQTAVTLRDETNNPGIKTWQASGGKIRPSLKPFYLVQMGPYRKAAQCQFRIPAV